MTAVNPGESPKQLVLVVDDEPMILRSASMALAMAGYQVIVAENGAAGLELFLAAPDSIALVITDVMMPLLNGLEMAQRIKAARPDARIILMSAYSDAVILTMDGPKYPLIRKPFLPEDLLRVVSANLAPPTATA
jgi:two-component system, cell cycle sensor histidine kinase and response regulator CckA